MGGGYVAASVNAAPRAIRLGRGDEIWILEGSSIPLHRPLRKEDELSKAKINKLRLYCYADETGPDTEGKMFLVAVVITTSERRYAIEQNLEELEVESEKGFLKWKSTSVSRKRAYLQGIFNIDDLQGGLFYAVYRDTKDYLRLVTLTIARAVMQFSQGREHKATIYIDGLKKSEFSQVARYLSQTGVRRRKIRGLDDESSAYIRLADALAGFFRDYEEEKSYTKELFQLFSKRNFVRKLA